MRGGGVGDESDWGGFRGIDISRACFRLVIDSVDNDQCLGRNLVTQGSEI